MDLVTLVKKLTGRVLSEKQLALARERFKKKSNSSFIEYKMEGETPVVERQLLQFATTQDISHPEVLHSQYYNQRTVTRFYTPEGLLEEELIQRGSMCVGDRRKTLAFRYDPPGSFKRTRIHSGNLIGLNPDNDDKGRRVTIYG